MNIIFLDCDGVLSLMNQWNQDLLQDKESDFDKNIHLKFPVENVESVILASDGLKSFTFNGTTKYLSDVLLDLVSFKNFEGSFLKRRLNRMIKDYSPMSNYDDVSICIMRRKS